AKQYHSQLLAHLLYFADAKSPQQALESTENALHRSSSVIIIFPKSPSNRRHPYSRTRDSDLPPPPSSGPIPPAASLSCSEKMDGMHGSEPGMMHYLEDQHHHGLHHMNDGDDIDQDDNGDHNNMGNTDGVNEVMDGDVNSMANQSNNHDGLIPVGGSENNNQLTLSFQGQVYVFDSVSPEKVQAVLLLLGGREVPPNIPAAPISAVSNREASSTPPKLNVPQRIASLIRFREKRKERNFDKKIRYTVRKEVALRMQRNKGQFTSSKPSNDDSTSNWDSNPNWGNDGSQVQDISCRHCGANAKNTPMMRRGPEGPRTLCNACGLMWANKGTLRDLSKTASLLTSPPVRNRNEENGNFEAEEMVLSAAGNGNDSS
ncbi:GATA transcription factor 24-like, partial [Striga asiatica]